MLIRRARKNNTGSASLPEVGRLLANLSDRGVGAVNGRGARGRKLRTASEEGVLQCLRRRQPVASVHV